MKMEAVIKKLRIGGISIRSVDSASLVLLGDAEDIAICGVTDTPADSLIFGLPELLVPLLPPHASDEGR